jgi:hypothetical protein
MITPQLTSIPDEDICLVRTHVEKLVGVSDRPLHAYAHKLLGNMVHPNWGVEWCLPRWLGSRLAIPELVQRDLLLANTLGLAYVRLYDDRIDREISREHLQSSQRLEDVFFNEAKRLLGRVFDERSNFWVHFHDYIHRWQSAGVPDAKSPPLESSELDKLADAGAPLYIVCAAAYALNPSFMPLEKIIQPVRSYLAAAVLYDHIKDWYSDLLAHRQNIFIQTMSGGEIDADDVDRLAIRVRMEFIHQDRIRLYNKQICELLGRAAVSAQAAGLTQFAQHLIALEAEARSSGERTLRGVREIVGSAVVPG